MPEYIYLDIETIPTQDPKVIERLSNGVKEAVLQTDFTPPSNYRDQAKIDAWIADKKASAAGDYAAATLQRALDVKEKIAKTSFDGGLGHCICIGWAVGAEDPDALLIDNVKDERDFLRETFAKISGQLSIYETPVLVGHNVIGFDLRFLWQRAMVLGVQMPPWLPKDPKPWDRTVDDTMLMWAGARGSVSLDTLCAVFGIEGKNGFSGADIADRWAAGDMHKIAEYCADGDVGKTRRIHWKMLAADSREIPVKKPKVMVQCASCDGVGTVINVDDKEVTCTICGGTGGMEK